MSTVSPTEEKAAPSRAWPVLVVVVCAQMLIWLDTSVLNVAVTTLADPDEGLGATPAELEWVASAYTLVFGTLFAGGALADRFGPRTTLIAGLALFGAASGAGAFASSPAWLIVARAFMGAGSALLMPATLSVIVQSTPEEKRTRAIAIWSSSSGLGVAVGPVVGGALLSHFWWGSVFLVNVPIVALCLAGVVAVVPELKGPRRRVLDLPGMGLSVLGLGGVVYGIIELGNGRTWYGPHVFLPLLLGGALLTAFVAGQRRSPAPSLDLRLFRQPGFTAGSVVLLIAFMALAGHLFYAAFYLQGPRGLSPADAGTVMIAAAVGIVLGSQASPAMSRIAVGPVDGRGRSPGHGRHVRRLSVVRRTDLHPDRRRAAVGAGVRDGSGRYAGHGRDDERGAAASRGRRIGRQQRHTAGGRDARGGDGRLGPLRGVPGADGGRRTAR